MINLPGGIDMRQWGDPEMLAVLYESCGLVGFGRSNHTPRHYPPHFRREMIDRMLGGEAVSDVLSVTIAPTGALFDTLASAARVVR
jgi:hypothetical protein